MLPPATCWGNRQWTACWRQAAGGAADQLQCNAAQPGCRQGASMQPPQALPSCCLPPNAGCRSRAAAPSSLPGPGCPRQPRAPSQLLSAPAQARAPAPAAALRARLQGNERKVATKRKPSQAWAARPRTISARFNRPTARSSQPTMARPAVQHPWCTLAARCLPACLPSAPRAQSLQQSPRTTAARPGSRPKTGPDPAQMRSAPAAASRQGTAIGCAVKL